MCCDLQEVLQGGVPRAYGGGGAGNASMEAAMGGGVDPGSHYECLAPSALYDKLRKLRKPLG